MRMAQHTLLLAWLLAALAGCSSTGTDSMNSGSSTYGSSGSAGTATGGGTAKADAMPSAQGTSGSASMATGAMKDDEAGMGAMGAGMMESAVVTSIETVRAGTASGTGSGSQGTSGTAGASGSGQMYRVTLRMDDGTSRVLMQDWAPGFKAGERVNVQNGAIQMKR